MKRRLKQLEAVLATARALVTSIEAVLAEANAPEQPLAMTLNDAAKASGLSPHTLRSWCKSGRLRSARGPRGAYLVRLEDVNEAIEAAPAEATQRQRGANVIDLDQWERETERQLHVIGGE